jgi:hypothetical protein
MMWVQLDGFKMQTAGAVYMTHAVARLQGSPYLGRSQAAVVELVAGLGVVLHPRLLELLHLLYLLGPRLELWKNGIVLLSAHTHWETGSGRWRHSVLGMVRPEGGGMTSRVGVSGT